MESATNVHVDKGTLSMHMQIHASVVYDPLQTVVNVIIYARGLYGETLVSSSKMIV